MHLKEFSIKLNIYNGEIYDTKLKRNVSVANKKDLKKLWSDKKFLNAVEEARNIYLSSNPDKELPSYIHLI